ncbi:MAG: cytochrome c [Rhodobacteraceae bacterium]|jgi:mono/diheme cytochrome c family protein|nr:cytochrome c [Paracoccaceae bacterium]
MKRALTLALLIALPAQAQDIEPGDAMEGGELFATYCSACHGTEGRGDGRMAPILNVLPADLTQLSSGNAGVFPIARVVFQIDGRDPLLAHGGDMPLFGEFFQGADTPIKAEDGQPIMTSKPIADLVAWLQGIQE